MSIVDDFRELISGVSGIAVLVLCYRGFQYYDENGYEVFVEDLTDGIGDTLVAGYTHPAFGLCCLMPIFLLILFSFYTEKSEDYVHSEDDVQDEEE
jgi:hypothetical protein